MDLKCCREDLLQRKDEGGAGEMAQVLRGNTVPSEDLTSVFRAYIERCWKHIHINIIKSNKNESFYK